MRLHEPRNGRFVCFRRVFGVVCGFTAANADGIINIPLDRAEGASFNPNRVFVLLPFMGGGKGLVRFGEHVCRIVAWFVSRFR